MSANPLVAGPVNTSSAFGGAGVVESVADLCTSLKNGDWLAAGLAGVGAAMDLVATVSDPLGSLIGAGLGWLIEHLQPLKGWLNDLTGDAGAVLGFAGTWENIAAAMASAGDELDRVVRADLEAMSGASITAYATYADGLADQIRATGASASAIGSALTTCSMVVQVVHDLVRDTLAQLVGSIISWAAEAIFTLGLATPVIIEQVTTRVSALATKVGRSVTDVITSAKSLKNLLEALQDLLTRLGKDLRTTVPGGHARPDAPTAPTRHASGLVLGGGAERNLYDQMMDPHIHLDNAHIVEAGYDPLGGSLSREDFIDEYLTTPDPEAPGAIEWNWPDNRGAVAGSEVGRPLGPGDAELIIDRVGGDGGEYFSPRDTPFGQRALPPDRLNFGRSGYRIDTSHPLATHGGVMIESSTIAPAFGQRGGAIQYRFLDIEGKVMSTAELKRLKLLIDPRS